MTTINTTNTTVTNATQIKNTKEEMVSMKNLVKGISSEVLTKALKSTLANAGIKFPKELKVSIGCGGKLVSNAAEILIIKAGVSPLRDTGNRLQHSFPYEVAVKSAQRINAVMHSDAYLAKVEEILIKIEERSSILTAPKISERTEKMVGLIAARKAVEQEKKYRMMFINHSRDLTRTVNRHISSVHFMNTAKEYVEFTLFATNRADHIPNIDRFNVGKFIQKARKNVLDKKQSVTVNVIKVTEDKFGDYHTSILVSKMDENEAIRKGLIKSCVLPDKVYRAKYGKSYVECDNFSKDILVVDLQNAPKQCMKMTEIFVWWNGERTIFATKENEDYIDLVTKKIVTRNTNPRIYNIIGGSPSSLRKCQTLAFDTTDGHEKIANMLDTLTEGAYSKELGKTINAEQLAKYVTRFFSWTAPNAVLGTINHAAIYMGKWCNSALDGVGYLFAKFYAKCMENLFGIKTSPKDVIGTGVQCRPYSAKVFAPVVNENLFKLLCAEAENVFYIPVVTPEISRKLDDAFHGANNEFKNAMIVFGEEGCEPEFVSDLNGYKTVFNWGEPTGLRVLDIAKPGIAHTSIQMLEVPLNNNPKGTVELIKELREEMVYSIFEDLFIKKEVKVPSLIDIEKNFYPHNVIKSIAPEFALNKDMATLKKIIEEFATRDNKASNKFKFEIDGEYARLTSDLSLIISELGILQYGEGYSSAANMYFDDPSNTERFFNTDSESYFVTNKKMNMLTRKMWSQRIVSMFKYPKMGKEEFYRFSSLSLKTIKSRIDRLDIDKEFKKILFGFFKDMKPGMIVVPGCEWIKKQCAGLDFDYDGATLVFDCRFNALLPNNIKITNIILPKELKKNKAKTTTKSKGVAGKISTVNLNEGMGIKLSVENLHQAYINYLTANSDGWSVGSITNCNSTQLAALQIAKYAKETLGTEESKRYMDLLRTMLGQWFGTKVNPAQGGDGEYNGLPKRTVDLCTMSDGFMFGTDLDGTNTIDFSGCKGIVTDVSEETIAKAVEEMKYADWNNDDILFHIFEDLNDIFRYYQEIIIDSAKTGENVEVIIAPGRNFHALEINNNKIKFDWSSKLKESKFIVEINKEAPSEKKTVFKDLLYTVRTKYLAKDLNETIKTIFQDKLCGLSTEDVIKLAKTFDIAEYKELNKAFFYLKKIYGDVTRSWMNKCELAGDDEDALAIANKDYRKQIEYIANTGRALTYNIMSETKLGMYSKFISAFVIDSKGNVSPANDGGSSFGANVFKREYMLYILKHYANIKFCGEKLTYNAIYEDGDVVEFNHGINEYAVTTADITGEFVIREHEGVFYATKMIEDVMPKADFQNTVTFRINGCDERSLKDTCALLKVGQFVKLNAIIDVVDRNNKVIDFSMRNENGNKICDINGSDSNVFRNFINGKQGTIKSVVYDTAEYNKKEYEFLIVTVQC